MEPNVVEIASLLAACPKTQTPIKALTPEVIDVEQYQEVIDVEQYQEVIDVEQYVIQNGTVLNNNNVDNKNKGKAISHYEQFSGSASDCYVITNNIESYPLSNLPLEGMGNIAIAEASLLDPDSLVYEEDNVPDQSEYWMDEETDYYFPYQELFNAKDIPTGVEMSMDCFPNSICKQMAKSSGSSKSSHVKNEDKLDGTNIFSKKPTKVIGFQIPNSLSDGVTPVDQPMHALKRNSKGLISASAYSLPQYPPASQYYAPSFMVDPTTPNMWTYAPYELHPPIPGTVMGQAPVPVAASSGLFFQVPTTVHGYKGFVSHQRRVEEVISAPDSSRVKRNVEDYLGTYLSFKRFNIVEDFSDHHYASKGTTSKQHSKEWARRIQEEWRILENDLPEMIFVRAYESRMDLLRAVIIGAEGTPYHDGLFFFDIFFPDAYPSVPPMVKYHSGGLRINPNLYNCGKVCLSLLGTWAGSAKEKWIPNDSTMLQVLVSIQGLILNQKPYFNEPGFESTEGSQMGETSSKVYNENTFLLSLKTMVYTMRRPPKYFEDFSYGHFFNRAQDVLKACNAYKNGALVGSVVKGGVQAVEENSHSRSKKFRTDVATFVDTVLLKEFILLGVLGLEPEGEDKPSETNVADSNISHRSSSMIDGVSSS